jgi:FtsZ-binding cell division protein ZapB
MAKTERPADTEALDRLEDKVKLLVALVGRMRNEHAQTADALQRTTRELDDARLRLKEAEAAHAEMAALKDERETVRTRVSSLLAQIEDLNL